MLFTEYVDAIQANTSIEAFGLFKKTKKYDETKKYVVIQDKNFGEFEIFLITGELGTY